MSDKRGKEKPSEQYEALTGLATRSLFQRWLDNLRLSTRPYGSTALLIIDVDDFSSINHRYGTDTGDQLLQAIAATLEVQKRPQDLAGRIGDDEFALLLRDLKQPAEVKHFCRSLQHIFKDGFYISECQISINASIGAVIHNQDTINSQTFLKAAEIALNFAKNDKNIDVKILDKNLSDQSAELLHMRYSLKNSLHSNELFINYQPKIDVRTQKCSGVEALLRWQDTDYGLILPSKFIPIAEETGVINEVGLWVFERACNEFNDLLSKVNKELMLSINLSVTQFTKTLVDDVKKIIRKTKIDPACVELELTESRLMKDPDAAIDILKQLKAIGLQIAIDDFGTGYSSLSYLTRFPIDRLKIDASLIEHVPQHEQHMKVVQAIISLAHSLGLEVTAEGVENEAQYTFLKLLNCNEAQGFYFSKPLNKSTLLSHIKGFL